MKWPWNMCYLFFIGGVFLLTVTGSTSFGWFLFFVCCPISGTQETSLHEMRLMRYFGVGQQVVSILPWNFGSNAVSWPSAQNRHSLHHRGIGSSYLCPFLQGLELSDKSIQGPCVGLAHEIFRRQILDALDEHFVDPSLSVLNKFIWHNHLPQ